MRLFTPMSGIEIDVAEEKAQKYIAQGFKPVESKQPTKKPARKRTTKSKEQ